MLYKEELEEVIDIMSAHTDILAETVEKYYKGEISDKEASRIIKQEKEYYREVRKRLQKMQPYDTAAQSMQIFISLC